MKVSKSFSTVSSLVLSLFSQESGCFYETGVQLFMLSVTDLSGPSSAEGLNTITPVAIKRRLYYYIFMAFQKSDNDRFLLPGMAVFKMALQAHGNFVDYSSSSLILYFKTDKTQF
jgi:hypothetical protein